MSVQNKNDSLVKTLVDDPHYIVHEAGRVYTTITRNGQPGANWRALKGYPDKDGYLRINYKNHKLFVHHAFKNDLWSSMVIHHIDGDRANNNINNLEQVTQKTNIYYKNRRLGNT